MAVTPPEAAPLETTAVAVQTAHPRHKRRKVQQKERKCKVVYRDDKMSTRQCTFAMKFESIFEVKQYINCRARLHNIDQNDKLGTTPNNNISHTRLIYCTCDGI